MDLLFGEKGNDTLVGGTGADQMTGGSGADVFLYSGAFAGLSTLIAPDWIRDFSQSGSDKISFNGLARTGTGAPGALIWSDKTASSWGVWTTIRPATSDILVQADANGDGVADLAIVVTGPAQLAAADFLGIVAVPAPIVPATLQAGSGSDTLVLRISQDAYLGNAQYTVSVDGQKVGGVFTASADHAAGQSDTLTLKGDWALGPHTVSVAFLNDRWDGTAATDRNLYLDSATYNGAAVGNAAQPIMSSEQPGEFAVADQTALATAPPSLVTEAPVTGAPSGHARFFADSSPWNTAVLDTARFQEVTGLDALMDRHAVALTSWDPGYPSVAIYYASATDPLEEIRWMADTWSPVNGGGVKRFGNGATVDARLLSQSGTINKYPMNPYSTQHADKVWNNGGAPPVSQYDEWMQSQLLRIHVPVNAVPASDGDGYTVIIQPDGRALEMYSAIKIGDGTLISEMYSFTDSVAGLGTGAENGRRAAMIPAYAGAITDKDMEAGAIHHALAINVPASMQATGFTGPAFAFDSNPNYTGMLPMGSRLAIPNSVNVSQLGLQTEMGRMMAAAAQEYGVIVVDRGGSGITVATQYAPESKLLADYSWPIQADLVTIFQAAQLMQPDSVIWG
jgi:hypothetical protein